MNYTLVISIMIYAILMKIMKTKGYLLVYEFNVTLYWNLLSVFGYAV